MMKHTFFISVTDICIIANEEKGFFELVSIDSDALIDFDLISVNNKVFLCDGCAA